MNEVNNAAPGLKKHNISMLTVFFMIFCMVCAGAYGIEDMIPSAGPGLTIILLAVLPFFWSIPQGLVAAELGSAIPEEGGYYKWIQRALGEFWGFQAGWWRTLSIYIDSTLYVVLATGYLRVLVDLSEAQALAVKVLFILIFTYINIRGLSDVGRISSYFSVLVIATFLVMIVLGFAQWQHNPLLPFIPPGQTLGGSIGLGIAICMWMYAGYESMSTMAGEMTNPQVIPKATLISVPAIMLLYILATISGLAAVGNWQQWATAGGVSFVTVAVELGIPAFGIIFCIAAVASNASLYNTYLASGSRGFYAMAEDKMMPKFFSDIHPKYGTPYKAIISMAVVNLILCQYGFDVLVVLDVFLLMFAYILIYISAIALRIKNPDLPRPFRIPLGTKGVAIMCVPPILLAVIALFTNGTMYFIGGCLGVISGPIAYRLLKKKYGGLALPRLSGKSRLAARALSVVMALFIISAGFIVYFDRAEAHQALGDFNLAYVADTTPDIYYDWASELYALDIGGEDGYDLVIYYDGGFYGEISLEQRYEDEQAFAVDAFAAINSGPVSGLPLDWLDIYSRNFVCYNISAGDYATAQALTAVVGKLY